MLIILETLPIQLLIFGIKTNNCKIKGDCDIIDLNIDKYIDWS